MHGREGRQDRPTPYSSLAVRILIGVLMGAFLGLLELWFYEFDIAHLLAAIAAIGIWLRPAPSTDQR